MIYRLKAYSIRIFSKSRPKSDSSSQLAYAFGSLIDETIRIAFFYYGKCGMKFGLRAFTHGERWSYWPLNVESLCKYFLFVSDLVKIKAVLGNKASRTR